MRTIDLDLVEYSEATKLQLELVELISSGAQEATLFCRHPRVVTVGRATKPSDLSGWSGRLVETSRGGRATYHGPSQIVVYPILDLKRTHRDFKPRDLHGYMRALETLVCGALRDIGIQDPESRVSTNGEQSQTGVWVGERKIASIGIAVRKWTTYHGCAINVESDPEAFRGINPCGFQSSIMTSVQELLGEGHRNQLLQALMRRSQEAFAEETASLNIYSDKIL